MFSASAVHLRLAENIKNLAKPRMLIRYVVTFVTVSLSKATIQKKEEMWTLTISLVEDFRKHKPCTSCPMTVLTCKQWFLRAWMYGCMYCYPKRLTMSSSSLGFVGKWKMVSSAFGWAEQHPASWIYQTSHQSIYRSRWRWQMSLPTQMAWIDHNKVHRVVDAMDIIIDDAALYPCYTPLTLAFAINYPNAQS